MIVSPVTVRDDGACLVFPDGNVNDYVSYGGYVDDSYGSPKTDSFNKDSAYVVILDGSIYYDYWDVYHYSYGKLLSEHHHHRLLRRQRCDPPIPTDRSPITNSTGNAYRVISSGNVDDDVSGVFNSYGVMKYNLFYFMGIYQVDLKSSVNQIIGGFALRGPISRTVRSTWIWMVSSTMAIGMSGIPTAEFLLLSEHR